MNDLDFVEAVSEPQWSVSEQKRLLLKHFQTFDQLAHEMDTIPVVVNEWIKHQSWPITKAVAIRKMTDGGINERFLRKELQDVS